MEGRITEKDFLFTSSGVLSTRVGEEWMDGRSVLLTQPIKYVRPWNNVITFDKLSSDNLPPFYVRLCDDQVGHLSHYARSSRKTVHVAKLGLWWPWDFSQSGHISLHRENWGAAYTGPTINTKDRILKGGPPLPEFVDPCLPLTYTSCDRIMPQGTSGLKGSAPRRPEAKDVRVEKVLPKKREASVEEDQKIGGAFKKLCLGVGSLAAVKSEATPNNAPVFERKSRLFVENSSIKEALSFYECLVENAHQSQQRIVDLKAELKEIERQLEKNYDELHTKSQIRYAKKNEEVEKLKVDLAVSDGLLKASKTTVSMQDKKLQFLAPTQALLEEKESTIKDLKAQLAKWQSQARAMLGPLSGGGTSSSSTNDKPPTPAHKADTKAPPPIPKIAGTKPSPQAPKANTNPTVIKSPPNIPVPSPSHTTKPDISKTPTQVPKADQKATPIRPTPIPVNKAKTMLDSPRPGGAPMAPAASGAKKVTASVDEAPAATAPTKISPYQRWDRQLNGTTQVMPKSKPAS